MEQTKTSKELNGTMKSDIMTIIDLIQTKYSENLILQINKKNADIYTIIQSIEPRYRLVVFKEISNFLNEYDYCKGLRYAYTKTDEINTINSKLTLEETLKLFQAANPKLIMEKDYRRFLKMPEEINIYRGVDQKEYREAISWTIDRKRAIWFYQKYDSKGTVFKAKIKKEDIICYLDKSACGEKEVIVDYNKVYKIEKLNDYEINKKVVIETQNNIGLNMDYVIKATQYLVGSLVEVGVIPERKLVEEIFRTYQENGNYKSQYTIEFPSGEEIKLHKFIERIQ